MFIDWSFCHKTLRRKLLNGWHHKSRQREAWEREALFPSSGAHVLLSSSLYSAFFYSAFSTFSPPFSARYSPFSLTFRATLHRLRADLGTAAIRDGASIKDEPDTINQVSLVSLRVKEDNNIAGEEQQTIRRH